MSSNHLGLEKHMANMPGVLPQLSAGTAGEPGTTDAQKPPWPARDATGVQTQVAAEIQYAGSWPAITDKYFLSRCQELLGKRNRIDLTALVITAGGFLFFLIPIHKQDLGTLKGLWAIVRGLLVWAGFTVLVQGLAAGVKALTSGRPQQHD